MIRTITEARRAFPRGNYYTFRDHDAYGGCAIRVWSHTTDVAGRPELVGYLHGYEVSDDENGAEVIDYHPILMDTGHPRMVRALVSEVAP